MNKKVLIAIPAYNEADNIESILSSLNEYKKDALVINDGSSDDTLDIINRMDVNVISHKTNLGLAAAYSTMFDYAEKHNYTHLITFDGDGQHEASFLPQFIGMLNDFDLVAGNRFSFPDEIPESKLASNFFAVMLTRQTFGISLPDVACGYRGMKLNGDTKYVHSLHYGVVYEMLFKKLHNNKSVGFVNIPAKYDLSKPLMTSTSEIFGLVGEVIRYNQTPELKQVTYDLFMGNDFEIDLQGYNFKGKYINSSCYIISTDLLKAKQYYKDNFITNN